MGNRTYRENVSGFASLFLDREYTGFREARTSRLGSSGTPEANPSQDLPVGYIWVRLLSGRASTRATIGAGMRGFERIPDQPVLTGYNQRGELVCIKPLETQEAVGSMGNNLSSPSVIQQYVPSSLFTPGLVSAYYDNGVLIGGLTVKVQPISHNEQVIQGTVDVTSSVPGSASETRLAVIYWDVSAAALGVVNGTASTLPANTYTLADVVAIPLGDTDRIRLGAVVLSNGQTTITNLDTFFDARDWLTLEGSGVQSVVAGTGVSVDNTDPQNPIVSTSTSAGDYIHIRDKKAQNTSGGTFTSGAWRTRDLNEEVSDTGGHASLASNQITLAAGTYRAHIICPARAVDRHQARLQDITNTATLLLGTSGLNFAAGVGDQNFSFILGRFTLAGSTVIEVQHQCQTTAATNGFGVASNFTDEIFTVVELIRE